VIRLISFIKRLLSKEDDVRIRLYRVEDDEYMIEASYQDEVIFNTYGTTPEIAHEIAMWKLIKWYKKEIAPFE
jgi:hypothetical protein